MTLSHEKLSSNRSKLAVAQMKYNKLRSRIPAAEIAVVEGGEDSIFYSAAFLRENVALPDIFFIANGKDNVLGLRDWLQKAKEVSRTGTAIFFIDKDFDGLKNFAEGEDIYITPTYSIENILVSRHALQNLLRAEFNLGHEELIADIDKILGKFDALIIQHEIELKEVNELLYCLRREALSGNFLTEGSIDERCEKFACIDGGTLEVIKVATQAELRSLVRVVDNFDDKLVAKHSTAFAALTPAVEWRGKFLFYLFRRFISILIEDRNIKQPRHFSKGSGKVSFDSRQDSIVRILASMCIIPTCLKSFIAAVEIRRHQV